MDDLAVFQEWWFWTLVVLFSLVYYIFLRPRHEKTRDKKIAKKRKNFKSVRDEFTDKNSVAEIIDQVGIRGKKEITALNKRLRKAKYKKFTDVISDGQIPGFATQDRLLSQVEIIPTHYGIHFFDRMLKNEAIITWDMVQNIETEQEKNILAQTLKYVEETMLISGGSQDFKVEISFRRANDPMGYRIVIGRLGGQGTGVHKDLLPSLITLRSESIEMGLTVPSDATDPTVREHSTSVVDDPTPNSKELKLRALERLTELKEKGALTDEEFQAEKSELLASTESSEAPQEGPTFRDDEVVAEVQRIIKEKGIQLSQVAADNPESISKVAKLIHMAIPFPLGMVVKPKHIESIVLTLIEKNLG